MQSAAEKALQREDEGPTFQLPRLPLQQVGFDGDDEDLERGPQPQSESSLLFILDTHHLSCLGEFRCVERALSSIHTHLPQGIDSLIYIHFHEFTTFQTRGKGQRGIRCT